MKFLIDENLPISLKKKLIEAGYESIDIREIKMGATDNEIMQIVSDKGYVLISANYRHFANIILFPPSQYQGIIVVKMPRYSIEDVMRRIVKVVISLKEEDIKHSVVIIEPHRIRIRK